GDSVEALGLTGEETFAIEGLASGLQDGFKDGREGTVVATKPDGGEHRFTATVRIDTPQEIRYYQHGGILPFVLRQLLAARCGVSVCARPRRTFPGLPGSWIGSSGKIRGRRSAACAARATGSSRV